jgi:hypothetical protein
MNREPVACAWCLALTGLRTGLDGEAQWIIAVLVRLGLSRDQVEARVFGQAAVLLPDGRCEWMFPICERCSRRTGFRTALAIDGWDDDVPVVRQPAGGVS